MWFPDYLKPNNGVQQQHDLTYRSTVLIKACRASLFSQTHCSSSLSIACRASLFSLNMFFRLIECVLLCIAVQFEHVFPLYYVLPCIVVYS